MHGQCATGQRQAATTPATGIWIWGLAAVVLCMLVLVSPYPAAHAAPYIPQAQDRYRIMVFGDRMATGLLAGLWRVLKGDDRFEAKGRLREGTGLSRPRLLDWNKVIPSTLDSRPVDIGIVMLGANDARDIIVNGQVLRFGSPEWRAEYGRRWDTLIGHFRSRGIPLYIVGLPPVRNVALNQALRLIDGIIRARAAAHRVRYIETYREFADENGGYTENGFDVNGNFTRLRARNGIQFIRPGNTKLANLVATAIIQDVETAHRGESGVAGQDSASVGPPRGAGIAASEHPVVGRATPRGGIETVPIERLPEENATVVAVMESADVFSLQRARRNVAEDSTAAILFETGQWPAPLSGRTDDFRLPTWQIGKDGQKDE